MKHFRVFQLNTLLRSKMNLNKAEAVYLFVNNKVALRGGILGQLLFIKHLQILAFRMFMINTKTKMGFFTFNIANIIHLV